MNNSAIESKLVLQLVDFQCVSNLRKICDVIGQTMDNRQF